MLTSLLSVHNAAVGAVGAGVLTGAMLFGGPPVAQAAPAPTPTSGFEMSGPHGTPGGGGGWGGGGHGGGVGRGFDHGDRGIRDHGDRGMRDHGDRGMRDHDRGDHGHFGEGGHGHGGHWWW